MRPGDMHRNGHAVCGGCSMLVDSCPGGRRARRTDGWIYSGRDRLGWICEVCARWVRRSAPGGHATGKPSPLGRTHPLAGSLPCEAKRTPWETNGRKTRGGGTLALVGRLRNRRRRSKRNARRAANRKADRAVTVPNLDTLSPSEYRRYQLAERAREKRRKK